MEPLVALADVAQLAHGIDHPEGICVTQDGVVYVGGELGQLYRLEADGTATEVMRTGGFALGLAADGDGLVYMCDQVQQTIWRIDPATGEKLAFFTGLPDEALRVPNWGCFDDRGNYLLSDSGDWTGANGVIWIVPREGQPRVWSRDSSGFPNGMAVSADSRTLYALESNPPVLSATEILADGSAGARRVITDLAGTVPDGVAVTTDGRFVVACYRPDEIYLVSAEGRSALLAGDPQGTVLAGPTNVVFVGKELDQMLVPNIGRWHVSSFSSPGVRGIPLFYPRFTDGSSP